jgi:hypothetical protein
VSDNKTWFTIDIKDFYLGTPLPASRYEHVRIELSKLPPAAITTRNFTFSSTTCMAYLKPVASASFA